MNTATNPREVIGGNQTPDYAKIESIRLSDEYKGFKNTLEELAAEAAKTPEEIEDDPTALIAGGIIKRFRDLKERMENTRAVEKEPHLRRGNAVDAFFNGLKKLIQPEEKSERRTSPGYIDILQGKINAHQDRKEALERERLERESIEAARIAREAQEKVERERREAARLEIEAEQRRVEAERARAPAQIEQKAEVAQQASQAASGQAGAVAGAEIEAEQAMDRAQEARVATFAKPADIVRTRGVTADGGGVTLTKAKESFAYVTDRDALNKDKLWNSFTDEQIEMALRKWARATGHNEKMEGAEIGWRSKGVTR